MPRIFGFVNTLNFRIVSIFCNFCGGLCVSCPGDTKSCYHVYMSTENKRTLEFYNKHADLYCLRGEKFYTEPQGLKLDKVRKDFFSRSLDGISKDAKLFEIGSGDGREAGLINALGYNIQVSGAAESFLSILRDKGFSPVKFNIIDDHFNSSHDYILANAVFVHLTKSEVKDAVRKVYDALNDGGRFVITLKQSSDDDKEWKANIPGTSEERFFSYWDIDEAKTMLNDAGFKIIYFQQKDGERAPWLNIIAQKP